MFKFPRNLETARDNRIGLAYFFMAEAYRMEKKSELAKEYYLEMLDFEILRGWREVYWPELFYYKALAAESLGKHQAAREIFTELIRKGKKMVSEEPHKARYMLSLKRRQALIDQRAKGYFSMGLGYLGMGSSTKAVAMFSKALAENASHQAARLFMAGQTSVVADLKGSW